MRKGHRSHQAFHHCLVGCLPQTKFLNADSDRKENSLASHRHPVRMHFHWTASEKGLLLIYDDGFDYMVLLLSDLHPHFAGQRPDRKGVIPSRARGVIAWRPAVPLLAIGEV